MRHPSPISLWQTSNAGPERVLKKHAVTHWLGKHANEVDEDTNVVMEEL
jgi:hypothetical protein